MCRFSEGRMAGSKIAFDMLKEKSNTMIVDPSRMKTYALDTNCFIDAVNPKSPHYSPMEDLLRAYRSSRVSLRVSLQTLHELEQRQDEALDLARTLSELPHWPIGTWNEQVGSWKQQTGTWDDARRNNKIQTDLKALAKSGTDIRDRGAYIDALCSGLDGFVTSDKQLVGLGPSKRINKRFFTKVLTPKQLVRELGV